MKQTRQAAVELSGASDNTSRRIHHTLKPVQACQCSKFHSNRFTYGGVIAECVKTVLLAHKVNPCFTSITFEANNEDNQILRDDHEQWKQNATTTEQDNSSYLHIRTVVLFLIGLTQAVSVQCTPVFCCFLQKDWRNLAENCVVVDKAWRHLSTQRDKTVSWNNMTGAIWTCNSTNQIKL